MNGSFGFILKVMLLSAAIAIVIKQVAPNFNIPATNAIALSAVLLPPMGIAIALGWRRRLKI